MEKAADGGGAASPAMQVAAAGTGMQGAAGTGMQGTISPSTDGAPLSLYRRRSPLPNH
jgi:hypothetical protein